VALRTSTCTLLVAVHISGHGGKEGEEHSGDGHELHGAGRLRALRQPSVCSAQLSSGVTCSCTLRCDRAHDGSMLLAFIATDPRRLGCEYEISCANRSTQEEVNFWPFVSLTTRIRRTCERDKHRTHCTALLAVQDYGHESRVSKRRIEPYTWHGMRELRSATSRGTGQGVRRLRRVILQVCPCVRLQ
jgi:hypothetical protein